MSAPIDHNKVLGGKITKNNKTKSEPKRIPYQETIGSLMYLMIETNS